MNNEENNKLSKAAEAPEEEDTRPPVDPHNKLYTFLSLLIFAVLYLGWQIFRANFALTYSLYGDSLSFGEGALNTVLSETGLTDAGGSLPDGFEFEYARLQRNRFDNNNLYVALLLPEEIEAADDFAEMYIPFEYGNVSEDERVTLYPDPDLSAYYVYANRYVSIDDPMKSFIVYKSSDRFTAVYKSSDYSDNISGAFKEAQKISDKADRGGSYFSR